MADGSAHLVTASGITPPPMASNPADADRWLESGQRERLLEGTWEQDGRAYAGNLVADTRLEAWGPLSQAMNLFKSLVLQLACLYDEPPTVRNAEFDDESEGFLMRLNLWPRMQQHAKYVVGLRESAVRIEHHPDAAHGIELRLVNATRIEVAWHPSVATLPVAIREARLRSVAGRQAWCWDVWDVSDPEAPVYRIETAEPNPIDLTAAVLGEEAGLYPWVHEGKPFLPWVIYHAADTGRGWDPREWHELVQATYGLAMLWTFWLHCVKEASWDQKYAIDLVLQGLSRANAGTGGASRVTVDPTSLLMFKGKEGRGTVGSIGASVDPLAMAQSILLYQQVVATHLGVAPSDIRTTSADAQSGIAISLTREGLRKMQRRYQPQFRAGDEELLTKIAWIHNLFRDADMPALPEDGYRVSYPGLPLSAEEIDALLGKYERLIALGLRSEVDLLMEMEPGLTRDEALAQLVRVADERRKVAEAREADGESAGETKPAGDGLGGVALTAEDVQAIRDAKADGMTNREIAAEWGISLAAVAKLFRPSLAA